MVAVQEQHLNVVIFTTIERLKKLMVMMMRPANPLADLLITPPALTQLHAFLVAFWG